MRRRVTPFAITAGLVGSLILGFGTTGTFSAVTAALTNSTNTAGTGTLVMQETDGSGTQSGSCSSSSSSTNSASCSAYNKYGGSTTLTPGGPASTATVRIYDIGSMPASQFTITPQGCTFSNPSSTSGNICGFLRVNLTCTVTTNGTTSSTPVTIYDGTRSLTQIANTSVDLKTANACTPDPTSAGGNSYTTFSFAVSLAPATDSTVMGQTASQPILWTFTA